MDSVWPIDVEIFEGCTQMRLTRMHRMDRSEVMRDCHLLGFVLTDGAYLERKQLILPRSLLTQVSRIYIGA